MGEVCEIVRPVGTLASGKRVTAVLMDGRKVQARATKIVSRDFCGLILYDLRTKKAIPAEQIKGWINS